MMNTKRKLLSSLTLIISISLSSLSPSGTRQQLKVKTIFKTPSKPDTSLFRTCTAVMAPLSLFYLQNHQRLFPLSVTSSISFGSDLDMIIRRRRAESEDEYNGLVGEGEGHKPTLFPGPTKLSSSHAMQPKSVTLEFGALVQPQYFDFIFPFSRFWTIYTYQSFFKTC